MEALEKYERRLRLKEKATQTVYRCGLNKFLELQNMTLEQLAEMDPDELSLRVLETMKAETDAGKKNTTALLINKSVGFFRRSIGAPFSIEKDDLPRKIYNGSRGVTSAEIRELWDAAARSNHRLRNRALLLTLKDSGLRISDASHLTVQQYRDAREITDRDGYGVKHGERFKVFQPFETKKTQDLAHTIIGPEAVEAVDAYLQDRRDGLLFLNESGGTLTPRAVSELFRSPRVRGKLSGKFEKVSAHSMRKFNYTALSVLGEPMVRYLQGKTVGPYMQPSDADYVKAYIKAYDSLRVFGAPDAELQQLRAEGANQDARVASLEAQNAEMAARIARMEAQQAEFFAFVKMAKDKEKT